MQISGYTPYNQLPIALSYVSTNRKLLRDQYCIECGQPFISISEKFLTIDDAGIPVEYLRENERVIEARCKRHTCKQYYRIWV